MTEPFDDFEEDETDEDANDDDTEETDPDPPDDPDDPDTGILIEIADDKDATSWTELTADVDLYGGIGGTALRAGGQAHRGEIGTQGGFNLSDDSAATMPPVKRALRIRDTVTSPNTILQRGRVAEKSIGRGYLPMGDARHFGVQLDDANAELRGIPIRKWTRPAETDYARMIALWQTFLNGDPRPSTDLKITYLRNANTVSMPKHVYEDTDPYGVAVDCAEAAGKDVFITVDHQIFYDHPQSTRYSADISITDDNPDGVDSFAPEWEDGDPAQHGGDEFLSGAVVTWKGGRVAAVRSAVEDDHDYWRQAFGVDAKNAADARKRLRTILDEQAQEERTYNVAVTLSSADVWRVKYGQTISFRAAAAGLLDPVTLRIGSLMWEPLAPQRYRAHFELAFPRKLGPRGPGGPIAPTTGPVLEDGAAAAIARYQLSHEEGSGYFGPASGLWYRADPDFDFGGIAAPTKGVVSRRPEHNIPWPYTDCGVGTGGVAGLETREAWFRFQVDLADETLIGVRFTVAALTGVIGMADGDDTIICGVHTGADVDGTELTTRGEWTEVARIGDTGGEVFVPRSLLIDAGDGYCWFVLAPAWEIGSNLFICNSAGAKPEGYAEAGTNAAPVVTGVEVNITGKGLTPWVPISGDVDGVNDTFELLGWDGTGIPELRVGVTILGAGDFTYDSTALTVTFVDPPPAEMAGQLAARYNRSA